MRAKRDSGFHKRKALLKNDEQSRRAFYRQALGSQAVSSGVYPENGTAAEKLDAIKSALSTSTLSQSHQGRFLSRLGEFFCRLAKRVG